MSVGTGARALGCALLIVSACGAAEPAATPARVVVPPRNDLGIGTTRVVLPGPQGTPVPIVTYPSPVPPVVTPGTPNPGPTIPGFPTFPNGNGNPPVVIVPVQNGPYVINNGGFSYGWDYSSNYGSHFSWGYGSPCGRYPWPYFYVPRLGYFASDGYDVFDRRRERQRISIHVNSGSTLVLQQGALTGSAAFGNYTHWTHPLWGVMDEFGTYYGRPSQIIQGPAQTAANGNGSQNPGSSAADQSASHVTLKNMSDLDRGVWFLQRGGTHDAVSAFRLHVKSNDSDGKGWRWLGIALLQERRFDDASAVLRRAYTLDHKLADEALSPDEAGMSAAQMRDLTGRAVLFANRSKTASAWLTVATLMQAQGRRDVARQMIERARDAGLDLETYEPFAAALR